MTSKVFCATSLGFDGKLIEVECDASNGLPSLLIVGLGNKAIDEAKERVRSAIKNTGLDFPKKRITINLAPANLPKHGAHFDLPIAIALLVVSGQLPQESIADMLFVGELALDGSLRPIAGAISHVEVARANNIKTIIVPAANAEQASLVEGVSVIPAKSLREVYLHLNKSQLLSRHKPIDVPSGTSQSESIIDEIKGQEQAKRALLIAAAGRHNLLLSGPPGAGKTMLARAITSILPSLSRSEIIDITKLQSLAGENYETAAATRPFRSPHHSASHVALTGGGSIPRPGEISLAHHGVLFLDELPEYTRQALEALRQPLEDRHITIARASDTARFPADFMLIATRNPCPCGFAGDAEHECSCSAHQIQLYKKKISGPLLDRIDMIVEVSRVDHTKLLADSGGNAATDAMRTAVLRAQKRQQNRFGDTKKWNAAMTSKEVNTLALLQPNAQTLLERAGKALNLSARSYFKAIKVARTIADLDGSESITPAHVSESLQYRPRNNV